VEKMKVLFHVNEPERWNVALGHITNLIKDVGSEAVDVVLIANGQGISAYAEADKVEKMSVLAEQGVQFFACNNSLKLMCEQGNIRMPLDSLPQFITSLGNVFSSAARNDCMRYEFLPPFVTVVPAGVTAIIRKQQEGYAYVKP